VKSYLEDRILKYAGCSEETFILALIYMDQVVQFNPEFVISSLNVHRLLITAIMLASKFFDDVYYNNAYYARVGGISNAEVNSLEMEMLRMISFSLFVQPEQYERYRGSLYSHVVPHPQASLAHLPACRVAADPAPPSSAMTAYSSGVAPIPPTAVTHNAEQHACVQQMQTPSEQATVHGPFVGSAGRVDDGDLRKVGDISSGDIGSERRGLTACAGGIGGVQVTNATSSMLPAHILSNNNMLHSGAAASSLGVGLRGMPEVFGGVRETERGLVGHDEPLAFHPPSCQCAADSGHIMGGGVRSSVAVAGAHTCPRAIPAHTPHGHHGAHHVQMGFDAPADFSDPMLE
jgi:hypothetical protein